MFKRLREKNKTDDSQTIVSHSGGNNVGFSTGTKSSKRLCPQYNVCHAGEGEGVHCYIVKTKNHTNL